MILSPVFFVKLFIDCFIVINVLLKILKYFKVLSFNKDIFHNTSIFMNFCKSLRLRFRQGNFTPL